MNRRGHPQGIATKKKAPITPNIESLDIEEDEGTPEVKNLTDLCLEVICKNLKRFEHFGGLLDNGMLVRLIQKLKASERLTSAAFKLILVPGLQTLDLSGIFIGEGNLRRIGQQCPDLTLLDLSGSYSTVNNTMMEFIAKRCKMIKILRVGECKYLDDKFLKVIATNLKQLKYLNVSSLPLLSDEGLLEWAKQSPEMKQLQIQRHGSLVTTEGLKKLKEILPDMEIIDHKDEPYGVFSLHSPHPIFLKGKEWPTAQHYFQAQKFEGTEWEETIRAAKTPSQAKRLGLTRQHPIREDWESIKEEVMEEVLRAKMNAYPAIKQLLLDTAERTLVRHVRDRFWGDGLTGEGENRQGICLMKVRNALKNSPQWVE